MRTVPVVPVLLQGLWGSFFSRIEGRALKKPFRRGLCSPICTIVGQPLPAENLTPALLRQELLALQEENTSSRQ